MKLSETLRDKSKMFKTYTMKNAKHYREKLKT